MSQDTLESIAGKILLRCPSASRHLARDWVKNAFRRVMDERDWSWRVKYGQFLLPARYNTGTVTVTRNSTTVTGVSTVWDNSHVGQQFRPTATTVPIYTIKAVNSATSLELDSPYGGATQSGIGYEIYQAYVTVPSDFEHFTTVYDPSMNWRLWLNVTQASLSLYDAQRSNSGQGYCLSYLDHSSSRIGTVAAILQALGTGPVPVSTGNYSGPNDALFTVEVTTGGITGTAVFRWKKDSGSYTSSVTTTSTAQDLIDGVQIYWPTGNTYVLGNIFIIRVTASASPGLPRYEIWPHQKALYTYPYLYVSSLPDLDEPNAVLPRAVRGDVLLELALAEAAKWPGPSKDKPNPYYGLGLAALIQAKADAMVRSLEVEDDEVNEIDVKYPEITDMPYAPLPWYDTNWAQKHA